MLNIMLEHFMDGIFTVYGFLIMQLSFLFHVCKEIYLVVLQKMGTSGMYIYLYINIYVCVYTKFGP